MADRQIKAHAHEREQHKGRKVYAQQVGYGLDKVFHRDFVLVWDTGGLVDGGLVDWGLVDGSTGKLAQFLVILTLTS